MVKTIAFWKSWSAADRKLFGVLSSLCIGVCLVFGYVYFQNPSLAFVWEKFQRIEILESTTNSISIGISSIPMPVDNLLLFESITGSELQSTQWIHYILIVALWITICMGCAFITTLKRYSFFAAIGVLVLLIVSFHWELLEIFGVNTQLIDMGVIILFVGAAYLFQAIFKSCNFYFRLGVFAALSILVGIVVGTCSSVSAPFLHLAASSTIAAVCMSLFFVFMVSHEIPALLIGVVTSNKQGTRNGVHFIIISTIYLANLLITYLVREKLLEWDIYVVNSYVLLAVSATIGIWGLQKREPLYQDSVQSNAYLTFVYITFLLTAFSTISFAVASDNSVLMEVFNDLILFSHLGYGVVFILYAISNFGSLIWDNKPVYKVLYKPNVMSFFVFRTAGLISTFVFLSYSYPLSTYFDRVIAAYHNTEGDIYTVQGNFRVAEAYYRKSLAYRNTNHHAHYVLATIYSSQLDPLNELKEYTNLVNSTPSEISYLNLSDVTSRNGNYIDTRQTLANGLHIFKNSGILSNAQALNYQQIGLLDSAIFYFEKARRNNTTKTTAEANLFAASAKLKLKFSADSLLKILDSDDWAVKSNALALANAQQQSLDIHFSIDNDSVLSVKKSAFLCNQLINRGSKLDTATLKSIITLVNKPHNTSFKDYLLVAVAQAYYQQGQIKTAFDRLREVAYTSDNGKYYYRLAVWFLEQGEPLTAARYFQLAQTKAVIPHAAFNESLSLAEADSTHIALQHWKALLQSGDSAISQSVQSYIKILNTPLVNYQALTDEEKYGLCHYRFSFNDSLIFERIVESINDQDIRAKTILDRAKKCIAKDELSLAEGYLTKLAGMKLRTQSLAEEIKITQVLLSAELAKWDVVEKQLSSNIPFKYNYQKIFLEALLAEHNNKTKEAQAKYKYLSTANYLFEEGMVASANFYFKNDEDKLKGYSMLVNGLLARPYSIKLLKAYAKQAAILGFTDESRMALHKLNIYMRASSFQKYLKQNKNIFFAK